MEPSPLADHYTRYKLGTAKVIRWLSQQAHRITERSGNVVNLPSPFTTKTLIRLAKIISLAKPKAKVPVSILLVIEDVIRGRQRCADFYGQLEVNTKDGKFTPTNASHRHFISVLEEVRTLLKALDIEQPTTTGYSTAGNGKSTGDKPTNSAKNIFETLELEEPSDRLQTLPVMSKKDGKRPDQPPDDPELEEDVESKMAMSVWCMFEDIREVRNHLQSVWREYYDGKISFLAASELTQTAFVFIEHTVWGLEPNDDSPDISYDEISDFLGIETSMGHNGLILFMNKTNIAATSDAAELLCISAWTVLEDFRTCIDGAHNPRYKNIRQSHQPFSDTLRQCEPILRHMASVLGDQPTHGDVKGFWIDSFTQDLLEMCRARGPIPIETVARCQVLLDALPAFAGQTHIGNEVLKETLERSSYETRFKGYEQKVLGFGDPKLAQRARDILAMANRDVNFSRMDNARSQGLVGSYPWPSDLNPETLLEHLPLLAGFRLCHLKVGHCLSSFKVPAGDDREVDHAALLSMAYLYRAARSVGLVQNEWADMETVIASQAMDGFYVRDADSLAGYARHFDLAIGVSASAFARNAARRPGLPGKPTISAKMRKLLPPSNFARRRAHGADLVASGLNGYSAFYAALYKEAQRIHKAPTTHLTSVELLQTIRRGMEIDEVYLKFDFWAFSMRCRAMLNNLRKLEAGSMKKLMGKKTPDIIELTHAVLWQAADTPLNSRPRERPLLASLADGLQRLIVHDGASFVSVAQHGTSGRITESERPSSKYQWNGGEQINAYGEKQDHPGTYREALDDYVDEKRNRVLSATCAKFRELEKADITTEKRLAMTRAWANEEFVKAKLPLLIDTMEFLEEYQKVLITTKPKRNPALDMLLSMFGDPFKLYGWDEPGSAAQFKMQD